MYLVLGGIPYDQHTAKRHCHCPTRRSHLISLRITRYGLERLRRKPSLRADSHAPRLLSSRSSQHPFHRRIRAAYLRPVRQLLPRFARRHDKKHRPYKLNYETKEAWLLTLKKPEWFPITTATASSRDVFNKLFMKAFGIPFIANFE